MTYDLILDSEISASFPASTSYLFHFEIAFGAHLYWFDNIGKWLNCHYRFGSLFICQPIKYF